MLHKFFNRLFSILSSINAIQKVKKDDNGICYVTGLRRYLSVLLDLIIIVLFLQFCGQALNQLFMSSESSKILGQIAAKYQMQVPLSAEETAMQSKLIKLLVLNQIVQFIMLFSYVAYMWIRFGATPGKFLLGLRVVNAQTFEKLTLKQATKRFFPSYCQLHHYSWVSYGQVSINAAKLGTIRLQIQQLSQTKVLSVIK